MKNFVGPEESFCLELNNNSFMWILVIVKNRVFLHQVFYFVSFIVGFTRKSVQKHIMIAAALSAIASHSGTITSVLYRKNNYERSSDVNKRIR